MPRVDVGDVQDIIDTDASIPTINAMIEVASLWIDENMSACTAASAAMLAQIEKFLAAHLLTIQDPQLSSSSMEGVSETYLRDMRNGAVTDYLKTAISLDPCGIVRTAWLRDKQRFRFRVGKGYAADEDVADT